MVQGTTESSVKCFLRPVVIRSSCCQSQRKYLEARQPLKPSRLVEAALACS